MEHGFTGLEVLAGLGQVQHLGGQWAVEHVKLFGQRPTGGRDLALPGQQQHGSAGQKHDAQHPAARTGHFAALGEPVLRFTNDRAHDEPPDFDHEQQNAQHLEEEQVHGRGNADEHDQTVDPGDPSKHHQKALHGEREGLGV
ncbi:hypothetical protein D9M69_659630 [compost metagenome]